MDCEGYDGYEELGFDFGEGALEMATTSKEGSRRVNYPMFKERGSDGKYKYGKMIKSLFII